MRRRRCPQGVHLEVQLPPRLRTTQYNSNTRATVIGFSELRAKSVFYSELGDGQFSDLKFAEE